MDYEVGLYVKERLLPQEIIVKLRSGLQREKLECFVAFRRFILLFTLARISHTSRLSLKSPTLDL